VVAARAPALWLPLVAFVPLQPPEATHDVALVELHVSVEAAPLATEVGFAASVTVGVPGTMTVAVATLLVPPRPAQVNEYEFVAVSAPVLCVPLAALAPLQPPEATHEVALVELHVSVEAPPLATEVGFAVSVTVGAGTTVTLTVATLLVPPAPMQVNEYDVAAVSGPVLWLPLVALAPLQPPEAVHELALVEIQVSVEAPPLATEVGFAVSVTVGADTTATLAVATLLVPPAPMQVNEYDVAAVSDPVLWLPLVALVPLQFPEAVHEVALVELHVSVEAPPLATEVGFAVSVTVAVPGTVTVVLAPLLTPLAPMQVKEYTVVAVRAPVLWLPLVAFVPLQPPEAVHEVALVELHVSAEAVPLVTEVGFAVSVTVGRAPTVTVAVATLLVPPEPVQVSVYDVVAVRAPVLWLPLVATAPLQPPDAVHDVASVELQVSVEAPPLLTEVCAALRDAVGCVNGVTPTPPHAANSRDTPKGKKRITDDRIDTHPTKHELTVIENPLALRNLAMLRWSLRSFCFSLYRPNIRERPVILHYCKPVANRGQRATRCAVRHPQKHILSNVRQSGVEAQNVVPTN
jgi:hypothetical protein